LPLQQSASARQTSLFCLHSDVAAQVPALQSPEQQSPLPAQALPVALQPPPLGIDPQTPALQAPPQHSLAAVQPPVSAVHGLVLHAPFVQ
jgi:hypothetical protein